MRVVRDIVRRACVYAATPRARPGRLGASRATYVRTSMGVFIAMYVRARRRDGCAHVRTVRPHDVDANTGAPRTHPSRLPLDRWSRPSARRFDFPRATVDHVPSSTHDDDDGARGGRARGVGARDGKGGDVDVTRATDGETM